MMGPLTTTFRQDRYIDVRAPARVGRLVEPALAQPDAPPRPGVRVAELEPAGAGELGREGREEEGPVLLGRELDGLVAFLLGDRDVAAHGGARFRCYLDLSQPEKVESKIWKLVFFGGQFIRQKHCNIRIVAIENLPCSQFLSHDGKIWNLRMRPETHISTRICLKMNMRF